MTAPVRRPAALAAGLALMLSLATGCGNDVPPPSGGEAVPTTLAPKPTAKMQPRPRIVAGSPRMTLSGVSQASGDKVWQQSLDLVSNWLLNPKYMLRHRVEIDELDGLTRIMTRDAAKRWRRQAHRALGGYVRPDPVWWTRKNKLDLAVFQLVTFNAPLPSDRGWDTPMMTSIRIPDGFMLGQGAAIGVILPVETTFRLIGEGRTYRVPTSSTLGLTWRLEGGTWKLDAWWRTIHTDPEKVKTWQPGEAPPSEATPHKSGSSASADQPSADPTLIPD